MSRRAGRWAGSKVVRFSPSTAALGKDELPVSGIWVHPPVVAPPEECPPRLLPPMFRNTILDSIEVRVAKGRSFEEMHGEPGSPDSALWARVPGHLSPSAATSGHIR